MSRGAFGVPLATFVGLSDNFAGGYSSGNNSDEITLRELLDLAMGGSGGINAKSFPDGLTGVLRSNLQKNATAMLTAAIAIPIGFKVGTKLLRKPVINPANRLIKMAGLGNEVKV